MDERALRAARRLKAIAETGLYYGRDSFDRERYSEIARVAQELLALHAAADVVEVDRILPIRPVPATPVLDARAFVLHGDKVLLVNEVTDNRWSLPGGWVEVNESLRESVEREVLEESGIRCKAERLLAVWDRDRHGHTPLAIHCFKLVVYCKAVDLGTFNTNSETLGADFFAIDELPELSVGRVTAKQILTAYAMVQAGDEQAQFD